MTRFDVLTTGGDCEECTRMRALLRRMGARFRTRKVSPERLQALTGRTASPQVLVHEDNPPVTTLVGREDELVGFFGLLDNHTQPAVSKQRCSRRARPCTDCEQ